MQTRTMVLIAIAGFVGILFLLTDPLSIIQDTDCEWRGEIDGQEFQTLDELEQAMGSQAFDQFIGDIEENPDLDIRETDSRVEYRAC